MKPSNVGAVLLAAGRGNRMEHETPKCYLKLLDRPILSYSIEKFVQYEPLSELLIVVHPDDTTRLKTEVLAHIQIPESIRFKVVQGGSERQDSALAGVREATSDYVYVHDAARPLFPMLLLDKLKQSAQRDGAAVPALSIVDSLRKVDHDKIAADIDRTGICAIQTPQCFNREILLGALEEANNRAQYFTDESAALLEICNIRSSVVAGSRFNIKITTHVDLQLAEIFLNYPELVV